MVKELEHTCSVFLPFMGFRPLVVLQNDLWYSSWNNAMAKADSTLNMTSFHKGDWIKGTYLVQYPSGFSELAALLTLDLYQRRDDLSSLSCKLAFPLLLGKRGFSSLLSSLHWEEQTVSSDELITETIIKQRRNYNVNWGDDVDVVGVNKNRLPISNSFTSIIILNTTAHYWRIGSISTLHRVNQLDISKSV